RNGSFRLSKSGDVTTAEGYALRTRNGTALRLVSSEPPEVAPDGGVRQNGQLVGQLELVEFRNPSALAKQGANYFRNADLRQGPVPAASAEVHQGQLENSNVSAPEGAVRLIGVMRQFEMLQKAITLGAEMNRKAIDEVARV
ncbi:MAG TPA: flagellar basal body rod C-terminal domain-containing protein, partial [Bryobacteraceae bacterium]|nr:flagellar basal body rod C-terminal domain-containing protein [Bryobacteraceae bacterium]